MIQTFFALLTSWSAPTSYSHALMPSYPRMGLGGLRLGSKGLGSLGASDGATTVDAKRGSACDAYCARSFRFLAATACFSVFTTSKSRLPIWTSAVQCREHVCLHPAQTCALVSLV